MARGGPERLKLPMYASGFPDSAPRLRSAHRDDHLKASPPPSATYNGEHDPSYTPYLPPPTPTYRTRPHRWPFNFFWKPRQRTVRAILKYGLPSALLVLLLIFYFYEPHIEIAFYSRDWVNQEIEPIEPLSGCFDPFRVSPKYNLSEALYGRRRTEVQAGMPMRLGLDCYDFAGTIQIHPDDERDRNNGWIPPDARMQFHTYWRADLAPFGSRQEWMIKSFFATQDVTASLLILWSNGDLSENEILKRYLAQYPDAFALRVVDVITLARETALDGSEMLQMKDAKAWIDGDLIRLLLLWTYGGVWVDMDSLLTRDLTPLLEHEFVTQWDCYDKIYQPLNGALMRFRQHSPYLCEAFHIMSTSAPPRIHSTDWGALLYFKLWRRLLAHAVPPFKILPFCFSDGRSCRLDNRLPDPFTPDNRAGKWTMGLGLEEGGGLDDVLGKVFSVHLHNQWEKSFPRVYAYRVGCKYNIETARLLAFTSQVAHIWYILAKAQYNTCALVCTVIQALETETVEQSWDADSLLMIQAIFLKAKTQNKDRRIIPIHAPMIFLAISGCQFTIETTASFKMLAQLLNIGHCALSTIDSPAECKKPSLTQAISLHTPRADHVVHERRIQDPAWTRTQRLKGDVILPLRIGLKQRNLELLPDFLMSVSDPSSSSFGQHWTPEKVIEMFAPASEAGDRVHAWLVSAGFEESRLRRSANRAWFEVRDATAGEVEQLLDARYHVYKREEGGEHVAADSYSLPPNIAEVVDIIMPTVQPHLKITNTGYPLPLRKRADVGSVVGPIGCDIATTPDCLKALYNVTYTPTATDRNTFGIVSYYSNTYLQSDLDTFFRNFSPALVGKSPQLVSIDGGSITLDATSSVDETGYILQYAMTLVQPQPILLLQVGGQQTGPIISFNEWLDAVDGSYCASNGGDDFTYDPEIPSPFPNGQKEHTCGIIRPPNVVSNSQADHEYRFSQFYIQRQCNEFAKLGLMGVTVIYSAGNTGVSGPQSGVCLDKNGSMNANASYFNPAWPASCPWVTAVGGTQVKANTSVLSPSAEEIWNEEILPGIFESGGGGFSNRFPTPDYQKTSVKTFLDGLRKTDPTLLKNFNVRGRAFPDLSANSRQFVSIDNGSVSTSSGTSGAVPTIAAIITLVNDARIAAGKKPVGFINPIIYSPTFASAFNDITSGTSQGCQGLQGDRAGGFKAGKGWDPAAGVGTPNLGLLIEKWLMLP